MCYFWSLLDKEAKHQNWCNFSRVVTSLPRTRPQSVSNSGLKCTESLRFQVLCRKKKTSYIHEKGDALTVLFIISPRSVHWKQNLLNCCEFVIEDAILSTSALLKASWIDEISEYVHLPLRELEQNKLAIYLYLIGNVELWVNPIRSEGFNLHLYPFMSDCGHCCFTVFARKDIEAIFISLVHSQEFWICTDSWAVNVN